MFKAVLAAGVLAFCMASNSSAATVIFQDNFDSNIGALNGTPIGWTVADGTVDIIGDNGVPYVNGRPPIDIVPGNGMYLDMDGSTRNAGRITTIQSFSVVNGEKYTLSFSYGKNGVDAETLTFGFGGFLGSVSLVSGALAGFTSEVINFTATATGFTSLFFEGSGGDNRGALLDNVVLTAVPLPAGGMMLVGGLAALCALRRRKPA